MKKLEFGVVIASLQRQRELLHSRLRTEGTNEALVEEKVEIELAISTLLFCEKLQLSHRSRVLQLPSLGNSFAEYGIVELDEMGSHVRPLAIDGVPVEVTAHSLVIERPVELARYYIDG